MSTFMQGAWSLLLNRYCATDDVVFGITVSGRPYELAGVESMVGLLINTLPVRVKLAADDSCLTSLKNLQNSVAGLLEFEHTSLKEIQEWCDLPRNLALFDTLMVFENFAGSGSAFDLGGEVELASSHLSRTNYPLTIMVEPGAQLRLQVVYQRTRFDDDAIERLLAHLTNIVVAMTENIDQPIASFELLSAEERRTLTEEWNATRRQCPEVSVNRLFEQQAKLTPDAVAVVHEGAQLTYSELNASANQLAHYLKDLGVGPEGLVGICLERSIEMVVAVLATLKAGGAYVPLDPTYPESRLAFMLADSGVQVLLTEDRLLKRLPEYSGRIVRRGDQNIQISDTALINEASRENLSESPAAEHVAYVIYTSGSTGNPKGAMIEHRSLVNFALAAAHAYEISPRDRVLQFASLNFDTSAEEIFPALCSGACLVLRTDAMISSARDFLGGCDEFGVTVLDLPTAYWHELTDEICADKLALPQSLRLLILGGEKALPERLASWQALDDAGAVRLVNTYGPTEATIVATMSELSAGGTRAPQQLAEVPIGRPIANALVYVLDPLLRPVPVGIPGELYLGGAGVARGYLRRPDLTAEKFIPNPFSHEAGQRLYKTGDVVRYQSDGQLQFIGRIDHQVKVRGFRIELEEIEQALRTNERVSDAVVLVTEDAGVDKRLVAYVVSARGAESTGSDLRESLTSRLPAYMLPSAFVMLDALPLTPNGKLDRQALVRIEHQGVDSSADFAAPRGFLEESIAKVWCSLLKLERVSVHDNFFELGGHSLLGAKLISNLRRDMNINLKLIDVFQSPTIASLAALIYQRQTEEEPDDDLGSLLAELQSLSDEEAALTLAEELRQEPQITQSSLI
jgi:amino acid adenylation domain-containing protein